MAMKLKPVDVVTIGVGWAGSILGKELAQAGLTVVGLERGGDRAQADFALPQMHDQLKYERQLELFEPTSKFTLRFRNNSREETRPMRRLGPFPWGHGAGGAGVPWPGWTGWQAPCAFRLGAAPVDRDGATGSR